MYGPIIRDIRDKYYTYGPIIRDIRDKYYTYGPIIRDIRDIQKYVCMDHNYIRCIYSTASSNNEGGRAGSISRSTHFTAKLSAAFF